MTKEEFEIKLIEDLVKGIPYMYYYLEDNLEVLHENKDYFREYFLNSPRSAYCYARDVDNCPRKDTRKAACKDPYYAYRYSDDVDKGVRADTFNAVKGSSLEQDYLIYVGKPH